MSKVAACPPELTLRDYLLGRTPEPEAAGLDLHLSDCPRCRQTVAALSMEDTFVSELRRAALEQVPDNPVLERLLRRALSGSHTTVGPASPPCPDGDVASVLRPGAPGELGVLGGYRLLGVLGQGGMGVVFRARDEALGRDVALKVIRPALAGGEARERFLREARLAASVTHDHVVPVLHVGDQDGVPYLVMPLLEGESLETRLKREGKLPLDEALRVAAEAAEGLSAAHARGLVHRDVKPANLWLESPAGRVKVLDFGLARLVAGDKELTSPGALVGTPAYMAPEQAGRQGADQRADLFGLGATLYRMLTGVPPFSGDGPLEVLVSVARDEPTPPRRRDARIPAEVSALVMRLLEKNPARRPSTAREVAESLRGMRRRERPARRWWVAAAGAVAAACVMAGVVLLICGKDGSVREVPLKPGDIIEVVEQAEGKKDAAPEKPLPRVEPSPGGEPISAMAWATRPAKIKGVKSWTPVLASLHGGTVWATYSPDGKRLATMSQDGIVRIWDAKDGRLLQALVGHCIASGFSGELAWSPNGEKLADVRFSGSLRDSFLMVWDTKTGKRLLSRPSQMVGVGWSPDGNQLAGPIQDGSVEVWDAKKGEVFDRLGGGLGGAAGASVSWSPDGKSLARVAGSGAEFAVEVWARGANSWRNCGSLPGEPGLEKLVNLYTPHWSPDGAVFAVGNRSGIVKLFDARAGKQLKEITLDGKKLGLMRPVWDDDGRTIKEIHGDGGAWDAATGKKIRPLQSERLLRLDPGQKVSGSVVAWAPEGKEFISAAGLNANPDTLWVYDAREGKRLFTMEGFVFPTL